MFIYDLKTKQTNNKKTHHLSGRNPLTWYGASKVVSDDIVLKDQRIPAPKTSNKVYVYCGHSIQYLADFKTDVE